MRILIAGGGRTGATLALTLHAQNHEVRLVEHRPSVLAYIHRELPTELIYEGNPNDPRTLEFARIADAQVLVGGDIVHVTATVEGASQLGRRLEGAEA